ncbi:MAG TPA: hypothetical protein PLO49_07645 [Methanofastidiosum sp.]|nr:hypothetical protein [Methanofastidiosum sp.]
MFKLRISKDVVEAIRINFSNIKDRSFAIGICHNIVKNKDGKIVHENNEGILTRLTKTVSSNRNKVLEILQKLKSVGIICLYHDKKDPQFNTFIWEAQLEQNFHNEDWYDLTEDMPEYNHYKKLMERVINRKKLKDSNIRLDEKLIDKIQSNEAKEILKKRNNGEFVESLFKNSKSGRMFNIYSNMSKDIRHQMKDLNGRKLCEIDFKSCQIAILGKLIFENSLKTASQKMQEELKHFQDLAYNGFYEYFSDALNIPKNLLKKLSLKFFLDKSNQRNELNFSNDLIAKFYNSNLDIKNSYISFINLFQTTFPEISKYISGIIKNLEHDGKTLASLLQYQESKVLKSLLAKIKTIKDPEFNFFSIHDSIIFTENHSKDVKKIVYEFIKDLKSKNLFIKSKYSNLNQNTNKEYDEFHYVAKTDPNEFLLGISALESFFTCFEVNLDQSFPIIS